jgi:hypothetical protein
VGGYRQGGEHSGGLIVVASAFAAEVDIGSAQDMR